MTICKKCGTSKYNHNFPDTDVRVVVCGKCGKILGSLPYTEEYPKSYYEKKYNKEEEKKIEADLGGARRTESAGAEPLTKSRRAPQEIKVEEVEEKQSSLPSNEAKSNILPLSPPLLVREETSIF